MKKKDTEKLCIRIIPTLLTVFLLCVSIPTTWGKDKTQNKEKTTNINLLNVPLKNNFYLKKKKYSLFYFLLKLYLLLLLLI